MIFVSALRYRRELRFACVTKGADFSSWFEYAQALIENDGREARAAYQAAIYHVEQGTHFCDWRLWARRAAGGLRHAKLIHSCRKARGHREQHLPIAPFSLYCSLWWQGTEPPPEGVWPAPRLKNCRCVLITADTLGPKLQGARGEIVGVDELTPKAGLNTARGGLSPERLERLLAPDPKRNQSPLERGARSQL